MPDFPRFLEPKQLPGGGDPNRAIIILSFMPRLVEWLAKHPDAPREEWGDFLFCKMLPDMIKMHSDLDGKDVDRLESAVTTRRLRRIEAAIHDAHEFFSAGGELNDAMDMITRAVESAKKEIQ